ncbi:MAG: hypothetical protein J6N78_00390 [Clostridia bacterium]|nr:hypothetical protein [Clostridia bacterium]
MIKLFSFEDYELKISEEAYILKPFKDLLTRDKSKNKDQALNELGYIYFMCDPRSDYSYLIDLEERSKEVKVGLGLDNKWKPDKKVEDAMKYYETFKTPSARLLEASNTALVKLQEFLLNVDFYEKDKSGKYVMPVNQVTSAIEKVPKLVKSVKEAEKAYNEEIQEEAALRGGANKSVLEDLNDD